MEIVVSVRAKKLTNAKAIKALRHNLREPGSIKAKRGEEAYIKVDKISDNRTFIYWKDLLSDVRYFREMEFVGKKNIDNLFSSTLDRITKDYESQTDSRGRRKKLRKNTKIFEEIIVAFGSDRIREGKADRGLTDKEAEYINSQDFTQEIQNFCENLRKRHGYNDFIITEHRDEKTVHYQILAGRYNYETGKFQPKMSKAKLSKFDAGLQDLAVESFGGKVVRGKVNSKTVHDTLETMHIKEKAEKEAQAAMKLTEQKLKELQKIEAKTNEAKENLAQIQKHCKDTQDRLESAKRKLSKAEDVVVYQNQAMQDAQSKINNLETKIDISSSMLQTIKDEIDTASNELLNRQSQVEDKNKELKTLSSNISTVQSEILTQDAIKQRAKEIAVEIMESSKETKECDESVGFLGKTVKKLKTITNISKVKKGIEENLIKFAHYVDQSKTKILEILKANNINTPEELQAKLDDAQKAEELNEDILWYKNTIIERDEKIRKLERDLENAENNLKQADTDKEKVQTQLNEALDSQFNAEIKKSEYIELGAKMGMVISSISQKIKDYFIKFNSGAIVLPDTTSKTSHESIMELANSEYEKERDMQSLDSKDRLLDGYLSAVYSRNRNHASENFGLGR